MGSALILLVILLGAAIADELAARGATVIGATSKRAALEQADHVVVLDGGRAVATGTWAQLAPTWGHLAG